MAEESSAQSLRSALSSALDVALRHGAVVSDEMSQLRAAFRIDPYEWTHAFSLPGPDVRGTDPQRFATIDAAIRDGRLGLSAIAAVNIATVAGDLSVAADSARSDARPNAMSRQLVMLQSLANAKAESLVQFSHRVFSSTEEAQLRLASSRDPEAHRLLREAWDLLRADSLEDASVRLRSALDYDNTSFLACMCLAERDALRDMPERAEGYYRRAVSFATVCGPDVAGYARIRYARFLDLGGRLEAAYNLVDEALHQASRPEWRFYLCELLIRMGRVDEAFVHFETVLSVSREHFDAALLSPVMTGTGPALIERLLSYDLGARELVVQSLERTVGDMLYLEALVPAGSADASGERREVEALRQEAAGVLRNLVSCRFSGLPRLVEQAQVLVERFADTLKMRINDIVARVRSAASELELHRTRIPDRSEWAWTGEVPDFGLKLLVTSVCLLLSAIFTARGLGNMRQEDWQMSLGSSDLRLSGLQLLFVGLLLSLSLFVFWSQERAKRFRASIERWLAWKRSDKVLLDAQRVSQQMGSERLRTALGIGHSNQLQAALSEIDQLKAPSEAPLPSWVVEALATATY